MNQKRGPKLKKTQYSRRKNSLKTDRSSAGASVLHIPCIYKYLRLGLQDECQNPYAPCNGDTSRPRDWECNG